MATKREGSSCEDLPLRKGGRAEQVLAMLKGGGHKTFWGSFCAVHCTEIYLKGT